MIIEDIMDDDLAVEKTEGYRKNREVIYATVGNTVVIGPRIVDIVCGCLGDSLGDKVMKTEDLLLEMVKGENSLGDLESLAAVNSEGLIKSPVTILKAAQKLQQYAKSRDRYALIQKGVKDPPDMWTKIIEINGELYIVGSEGKEHSGIIETVQRVHGRLSSAENAYHFGGNETNRWGQESLVQAQSGDVEERLAGIIDAARNVAFDDVCLNPDISIWAMRQDDFPDKVRLCVHIPSNLRQEKY